MANAPAFIKGVVNLRGVIVPIVDMRIKFDLEQVNYDTFTVVIVLNIGTQVVGMVVDGVSDVITLTPEQLRPVPEFSSTIGSDHLLAIGSVEDRMLILLDIEKLMASADMGLVSNLSHRINGFHRIENPMKNLKIKTRLLVGFGRFIAMLLLFGLFAVQNMNLLASQTETSTSTRWRVYQRHPGRGRQHRPHAPRHEGRRPCPHAGRYSKGGSSGRPLSKEQGCHEDMRRS